ncbi:tRNA lysidine(34) synthetase TilS [Chloroflexota bacterium]
MKITCREPLEQRVLRFILENHLVAQRRKLLVAVSGGPDSVCLFHILAKLREKLDITLHVAHLDHQLRGIDSEADAEYVSQLACRLGIPATIETRDVKGYQARQHTSMEEAAREVRYTFLAEVAQSAGADRVAVGHTSDDHVETILLHLIRGTGTRGLRGLQPVNHWQSPENSLTVIRPLLPVNRWEITDYCCSHQLETRLDASNLSLSPLRNRIRHQLVPLLESYNPQVKEALLRTARLAADDLAALNKEATRLRSDIVQKQGEMFILDKTGFLELPLGLQRHLLRETIEELSGSLKNIEAGHIDEIIAIVSKPAGKRLNLPGGLVFVVEYDRCLLALGTASLSPFPLMKGECALEIPGETLLPGWRVAASVIKPEQIVEKEDDFTAWFDLDKTGDNLVVRCRQPGDRFQPLGMGQSKKLGEFMIDAKIPGAWRRHVPIVSSPRYPIWVVGWRIDDRAKVSENTRRVLSLKFERC